jgi:hypothetical protein
MSCRSFIAVPLAYQNRASLSTTANIYGEIPIVLPVRVS